MKTRSEKREEKRLREKNRMPSLADQVKRGPIRKKSALIHVTKKA